MADEVEGSILDRTLRNPAPARDLDELDDQGVPSTKDMDRHFPVGSGNGIITNGLQAQGRRFRETTVMMPCRAHNSYQARSARATGPRGTAFPRGTANVSCGGFLRPGRSCCG